MAEAGDDRLEGQVGNDTITDEDSEDRDRLFGGSGNDTLIATNDDGDGLLNVARGTDDCSGDVGDEFRGCATITQTPSA
jgi:Ca2+-binding RTX toxin-like protein